MSARPRRVTELYVWAALAVVAVALLIVAYFLLPQWIVPSGLSKADTVKSRDDVRGSGVQLGGAIAVALGTFLAARTYLLSRQAALTTRFSNAIEHLGSDRLAVRLGGVVELERLAVDDKSERWRILQQLAAHVRDEAEWTARRPAAQPAADVLAALRAITTRDASGDPSGVRLDLRGSDLRGVRLDKPCLRSVNLASAHLEGASLSGGADLRAANLFGAFLDNATLIEADLEGADLRGASMVDADLRRAKLGGAQLTQTKLHGADLRGAGDADLEGAEIDHRTRLPDGTTRPE